MASLAFFFFFVCVCLFSPLKERAECVTPVTFTLRIFKIIPYYSGVVGGFTFIIIIIIYCLFVVLLFVFPQLNLMKYAVILQLFCCILLSYSS